MELGLKGKVAIVTGGARGIGKGCSTVLAQEGCNLVVCDLSFDDEANANLNELEEKYGIEILRIPTDVSNEEKVEEAISQAIKHYGTVDYLVNNAGRGSIRKDFHELTTEDWRAVQDITLNSQFFMTRAFVRHLREQNKPGSIVCVLSKTAFATNSIQNSTYMSAKLGAYGIVKSVSNEYAPYGIRCNGIVPGYVQTERTYPDGDPRTERMRKILPTGEFATPLEMGRVTAFLLSDVSNQITGAAIDCTGGTMKMSQFKSDDVLILFDKLEKLDCQLVFIEDQKEFNRQMFTDYAHKVEHNGPDQFEPNSELLKEIVDADILLVNFAPISSEIIKAAKKLKVICASRSGAEHINVKAASEKGIKVCVSPGRLSDPVSEYTIGMMLAESRNIARCSILANNGEWKTDSNNMAYNKCLNMSTVGIVGFGIIGQKVAEKLNAFGSNVIAYDPFCSKETFEKYGVKQVDLADLMSTSDFVTVHARLTEETHNLISREYINMMKKTAFFINTARAGLVDEEALIDALEEHRIGGAALDVFSVEPISKDNRILHLDNVTLTPHKAGGVSNVAAISLGIAIDNLCGYLQGQTLKNTKN